MQDHKTMTFDSNDADLRLLREVMRLRLGESLLRRETRSRYGASRSLPQGVAAGGETGALARAMQDRDIDPVKLAKELSLEDWATVTGRRRNRRRDTITVEPIRLDD